MRYHLADARRPPRVRGPSLGGLDGVRGLAPDLYLCARARGGGDGESPVAGCRVARREARDDLEHAARASEVDVAADLRAARPRVRRRDEGAACARLEPEVAPCG